LYLKYNISNIIIMADGITIEQTGLIQVFRSLDLDRKIIVSAEHTFPPTLSITKNHLTTPIGIALSSDGIAYDNGTSISNTTWTTLQNKIASVEAVAPNGGNASLLVVNKEVAIQNADTSPTRVIDTMAGDPTVVGEHFGIEWVGNTKPFIMESLDSTDLQINNTPLVLTDGTDDTTLTKDGMVITNTGGSSTHSFQLLNLLETGVGSCILNPNGGGGCPNPDDIRLYSMAHYVPILGGGYKAEETDMYDLNTEIARLPIKVTITQVAKKTVTRRGIVGIKSGAKKAVVYLKKGDKI
jgi:hypothetical protein